MVIYYRDFTVSFLNVQNLVSLTIIKYHFVKTTIFSIKTSNKKSIYLRCKRSYWTLINLVYSENFTVVITNFPPGKEFSRGSKIQSTKQSDNQGLGQSEQRISQAKNFFAVTLISSAGPYDTLPDTGSVSYGSYKMFPLLFGSSFYLLLWSCANNSAFCKLASLILYFLNLVYWRIEKYLTDNMKCVVLCGVLAISFAVVAAGPVVDEHQTPHVNSVSLTILKSINV